jgi:hypothetical protein
MMLWLCLQDLFFKASQNGMMAHKLLRWMGEPAIPQVKGQFTKGGSKKGKQGINIFGRAGEPQGW